MAGPRLTRWIVLVALGTLWTGAVVAPSPAPSSAEDPAREEAIAGRTEGDALRLGERMYRQGLLPSGEPMTGVVQGDVPVDGTMFSCQSCHLRSGVGTIEGSVITLPTNAGWLFQPFRGARMTETSRARLPAHLRVEVARPPYTAESLARALRLGVDPAGRKLGPVMPRYTLGDDDMAVLVHYLERLSAQPSPGVTGDTIRFATIVGPGASARQREAMLMPLRAHVDAANSQSRHQERRAAAGPFYKEEKYTAYRRLELIVWELAGPPETWRSQLEAHYDNRPVFALLGGVTGGAWWPIHEFCEDHRIPALFPVTDLPVVSPEGWYTLYVSKGRFQEGEAVARYLAGPGARGEGSAGESPVIQVFRDTPEGRALARGFRETWAGIRGAAGAARAEARERVTDRVLAPGELPDAAFWRELAEGSGGADLLVWLRGPELAGLEVLGDRTGKPGAIGLRIFLSAPLVGDDLSAVPEAVRSVTLLTHPYSLPGEKPRAELVTRQWLRSKGIPTSDERIQSQMYVLGWMLSGVIQKMRHDLYRDYFLDVMDMMRDQYYSVAAYPRLSFGPGQRYASKGCYLVELGPGAEPEVIRRTGWVIH